MTRDDIIEMAIDAGARNCANPDKWGILEISYENLERFANLVAADGYEKGWGDAMLRKSLEEK